MNSPVKLVEKTWVQVALGIIAGIIASLGIVAVNIAGFSLSFDSIRTVARAAHINAHLDWMLPVAIDGAMAVASVTAIVMKRLDRTPWYPWVVVAANVLISIGCNALHAYQGGGTKPLPGGWAMVVSAIPALNLALSLHLAIELVMAVANRNDKPADEQPAKNGFSQFSPTVIHGGTQPQPRPATQVARNRPSPHLAPPSAAPALNGSHQVPTERPQGEKPAPAQPAKPAASPGEKPAETPPAKVPAKPAERPAASAANGAKRPTHPFADDLNPSMRALARAYAKNPTKTNAELGKLAKVSEGTANRYLPKIRQAAIDSANADADEERAQGPLGGLPIPASQTPALAGAHNGHRLTLEEN